ncbi:TetR/AcrR family transcriptional regulator [Nocardioides sp.]|uniref:TetR/AcrR family transcriptional regulator n=1 Tax=Nocardioides sp. TaxID=35761 RepID=UPI003514D3A0
MSTASAGTSYHHGNLRTALVEAGVDAVRELGPDGVALRDLARRVGVSHNAAYRHFSDRDELLAAIADVGMTALTESGAARLAAVSDPDPVRRARLRLRELGRGYIDFARRERGLFRVAFAGYPSLESAPAMDLADSEHAGPFGQLNDCLDDLVRVGYLSPDARAGAEFACWAAVHGMSMLLLEGPLQKVPDEVATAIIDHMLTAIDRSQWASGSDYEPLD